MNGKYVISSVCCLLAACLCGCARESDSSKKPDPVVAVSPLSPHGGAPKGPPSDKAFVGVTRGQKLPGFTGKTIGTTFDEYSYFSSREWQETKKTAGKVYIDFRGLFESSGLDINSIKKGIARQGIEVKFVIEPDGAFSLAMVSKVEFTTDGNMHRYPLENGKKIIEQIYNNREIRF